jgi:hypothetical protein
MILEWKRYGGWEVHVVRNGQIKIVAFFYELFTVHFSKIESNNIQQMYFSMFSIYKNTPTCFGPSGLDTEQAGNSCNNHKGQTSHQWFYFTTILQHFNI